MGRAGDKDEIVVRHQQHVDAGDNQKVAPANGGKGLNETCFHLLGRWAVKVFPGHDLTSVTGFKAVRCARNDL